ncbi:MAG: hybrid sensor histidine kinase/response regulator [Planctomycetota bacterium]|jgi:signal transduction histidine kinase
MMQKRAKVLAIDDDALDLAIVRRMLSEEEYDLRTASTGKQALKTAADFQPEIVLLDIMMPGLDGYEVCRRMREDSMLARAKIIMVSSLAIVSERLEGYEAGADDYITKPFDEAELMAKMRVYQRLNSAEEVDRFKTNILRLLSQEACSQLGDLIGPAEMLLSQKNIDAEELRPLLEQIHRAAEYLHRFFDNAMVLSSLKSGERQFSMVPTNLGALIRGVIGEISAEAANRNVKIEEEFAINPTICLDEQQINTVVAAILDNAVRFSRSGGSVTVHVSSDNDDVCLSITDNGEGIDPKCQPYVFDEVSDPNATHRAQGRGLSLAIARQIVLGHNGTVSVESKKGSGSAFTVRLPATLPLEVAHCQE